MFNDSNDIAIRILSPSLQRKAIEELNEVSERIVVDLRDLREWMNKQGNLTVVVARKYIITRYLLFIVDYYYLYLNFT